MIKERNIRAEVEEEKRRSEEERDERMEVACGCKREGRKKR